MAKREFFISGQIIGDCIFLNEEISLYDNGIKRRRAKFKCICGKEFIDRIDKIKSLNSKGCGCRQGRIIHGLTRGGINKDEFRVWYKMLERCRNKKDKKYFDYGGRGIRVCERWQKSFPLFLEDLGKRPNKKYSLERIENAGNYEPNNCKWATKKEQARNRRSNVFITYKSETHCINGWAEKLSMHPMTFWARIYKYKWSLEKAITCPVRK